MTTHVLTDQQFVYHVDQHDRVVYCDAAWLRFAEANEAPELDAPAVLGRPLWDFIATAESQTLYQLLVAKVRAEHRPVTVSFRCDAPTCRRTMQLRIAPLANDHLAFTSTLVEEEPRPYVALLDPAVPRSEAYLKLCSWCKQVLVAGKGWLEVEDAAEVLQLFHQPRLPQISHAICELCYAGVMAVLE